MATASKTVASCQAWPPWAIGVTPAAASFSTAATNSSHVCGTDMPLASSTALLAQTQFVEWTFTGAEIHLPSCRANACNASGTTASQPSWAAISFRSASAPSLAQSRMSNPSICTAVGALPAVTRARRTVIACSPPPPATGMSCQPMPWLSRSCLSTFSAAASPPDVHQCSTSTSPAFAAPAASDVAARTPRILVFVYAMLSSQRIGRLRCPHPQA